MWALLLLKLQAFRPPVWLIVALACAGLVALGGLGAWRAAAALERTVSDARKAGKAEADAEWRAQIAKSEQAVAEARAEQARAAAAAEARAAQDQITIQDALARLEAANVALPRADACGLDRDRVRLLAR